LLSGAPLRTTGSPVDTAATSGTGWSFLVLVAVDWTQPASAADITVAQRIGNHEDAQNRETVVAAMAFQQSGPELVETLIKPRYGSCITNCERGH
jgi:hypothetical protein